MGWFCRCRRRPEDDLVFELPRDGRDGFLVTPSASGTARKALVTPKRNPRRTRIFVRMPCGEILPADLDLDWTTTQASEYIIANCRNVGLEGLENQRAVYDLRFRKRILQRDSTLKESGAEIGSVLGLVPTEPMAPLEVPSSCSEHS